MNCYKPEYLEYIRENKMDELYACVISKSLEHTKNVRYNKSDCLRCFFWWLDMDGGEDNFESFDFSMNQVRTLVHKLVYMSGEMYVCENENCEWC